MGAGEADLIPYKSALPAVERGVLVLAPHPDDEVFGCGGTLALLADRGDRVQVAVLTDSDWGQFDPGVVDARAARRAESVEAARLLGIPPPQFWGFTDRALAADETLIARIATALADTGADLLLAPSPREIHPDHYAVALAALEVARRADAPLRVLFYEVSATLAPNRLVDITPVAARKRAAMRAFRSQLALRRYDEYVDGLNRYRTHTLAMESVAAEAFHEIDAADIARDGVRAAIERVGAPPGRRAADALPLVSVLVRSMDRPTLDEALASVAAQTYRNIEIVVVDAKGSHRVLPAHSNGLPLRLVSRGGPLSRPAAANLALESARGDRLLFLDDDDLVLPNHVERLVRAAQSGGEWSAPYAGVRLIDGAGAVLDTYDYPDAAQRLLVHNPFPIHSVLIPRRAVDHGVRFDESFECFEDWDFWLQLSRKVTFVHVLGVSAVYRAALGDSGISAVADERKRAAGRAAVLARWLQRVSPQEFDAALDVERRRVRAASAALEQQHGYAESQRAHAEAQRARADALEARVQHLEQQLHWQVAALQARIDAMLNSRSWRITAPLRTVGSALRGERKKAVPAEEVAAPVPAAPPPAPAPGLDDEIARLLQGPAAPVLLFDHDLGGGANRYRRERVRQWLDQGRAVLAYFEDDLHPAPRAVLFHPREGALERANVSYESLADFASERPWSEIFFNNAAHAIDPLATPDLVAHIRRATGAPLTFALHDFHSVCPTYVLLTDAARFCGVPDDTAVCERCLTRNRFDPHGGRFSMFAWRAAWQRVFDVADRVLAFSHASATLLQRAYPATFDKIVVEPHRFDPPWDTAPPLPIEPDDGLRIGVVGTLSEAKGALMVEQLVDEIARRKLAIPVVVFGVLLGHAPRPGRTVTGAYRVERLPQLMAEHRINAAFFPSICPETFSYVLSELMSLALPIVAFDLGAQGERVRAYERGAVAAEVSAAAALDALLALHARQRKSRAAA